MCIPDPTEYASNKYTIILYSESMGDYVMIDDRMYYQIKSYNQGLKEILFETVPIFSVSP